MPESPAKKHIARYYDLSHAKEHLSSPSAGKEGKKLAKAIEKIQKKTGLMSLSAFARKLKAGSPTLTPGLAQSPK